MSKILAGIRVLELAGIGPSPFCGMLLADLGADVIVVQAPAERNAAAVEGDLIHRGKRGIMLDLKSADGVVAALSIGRHCDAVIEGMRPGVAERLGLGPAEFSAVNPKIVFGRITGWGQTGPLAMAAGHDINYVGVSGAGWFSGQPGQPPVPPPTLVGDVGGGALYLAVGLLAAILRARECGRGDVIDAAIIDCSAHLTSLLLSLRATGTLTDDRGGDKGGGWIDGAPWYRCYRCSDGKHVALGGLEGKFFDNLMAGLGLSRQFGPESQFDQSRWPEMAQRLTELFASAPRDTWLANMPIDESCFGPVLTPGEAAEHPHNRARGVYTSERGFLEATAAPRFASDHDRGAPQRFRRDVELKTLMRELQG